MAEEGELLIGKGDGNLHSVEPSGSLQNSHELQEPKKVRSDAEENDGCLLAKNIYIYTHMLIYIYVCVYICVYYMYHRARSRIFKNWERIYIYICMFNQRTMYVHIDMYVQVISVYVYIYTHINRDTVWFILSMFMGG